MRRSWRTSRPPQGASPSPRHRLASFSPDLAGGEPTKGWFSTAKKPARRSRPSAIHPRGTSCLASSEFSGGERMSVARVQCSAKKPSRACGAYAGGRSRYGCASTMTRASTSSRPIPNSGASPRVYTDRLVNCGNFLWQSPRPKIEGVDRGCAGKYPGMDVPQLEDYREQMCARLLHACAGRRCPTPNARHHA
jgi:hypothetical protein